MRLSLIISLLLLCFININAQNEIDAISSTLMKYVEGSTEGKPDLLKEAFHPELNLFYVKDKALKVWSGTEYIEDTKQGKPTGESGKIISIDYENNAAVAKLEISHPENPRTYVDYFLLLKLEGGWKIINKSFTKRTSNKLLDAKN